MRNYLILLLAVFLAGGCKKDAPVACQKSNPVTKPAKPRKKVLYVDSYHAGYPWSDGVTEGITSALATTFTKDGTLDNSQSDYELKIIRLDTKRNRSDSFIHDAVQNARKTIDIFQPDVIISSDDNAFKYLIMPHYKDTETPVVFCGINNSASVYGVPYTNTTGMIEVALIDQIIKYLGPYADGEVIGFLAYDTLSERKNANTYLDGYESKIVFVENFQQWKEEFIAFQTRVDILLLGPYNGMPDWDSHQAEHIVMSQTKIPTGYEAVWMAPFAIMGCAKVPQEQGRWAAEAAIEILKGKHPREIPISRNKQANILLNMKLAKQAGIIFPMELINRSEFVD